MVKPSPTESNCSQALIEVRERIAKACVKFERAPDTVSLLAASKSQSAAKIRELFHAGQHSFGENYTQELVNKAEEIRDLSIEWHYIGKIQSNKIKLLAEYAHCVQSIAELRHAKLLHENLMLKKRLPFPIYIAVNAGDEPQKGGVAIDSVTTLVQDIFLSCPGLSIQGIMAIPPDAISESCRDGTIPPLYRRLRTLADQIGERKLSLGMSGDLESAIGAGTSMVRIGTALFGKRITV